MRRPSLHPIDCVYLNLNSNLLCLFESDTVALTHNQVRLSAAIQDLDQDLPPVVTRGMLLETVGREEWAGVTLLEAGRKESSGRG